MLIVLSSQFYACTSFQRMKPIVCRSFIAETLESNLVRSVFSEALPRPACDVLSVRCRQGRERSVGSGSMPPRTRPSPSDSGVSTVSASGDSGGNQLSHPIRELAPYYQPSPLTRNLCLDQNLQMKKERSSQNRHRVVRQLSNSFRMLSLAQNCVGTG